MFIRSAIILINFWVTTFAQTPSFISHVCSYETPKSACDQLDRTNKVACKNVPNSVECLEQMIKGNRFSVLKAEEALLAASFYKTNEIQVIAEVNEELAFKSVVIVENRINNFNDLKGSKFCHPGYSHIEAIPHYILNELENELISQNSSFCKMSNSNQLESRLKFLSDFFTDSCRPGEWSQDSAVDKKLKNTYSSLCKLCAKQSCDSTSNEPLKAALECLEGFGQVGVSSLKEADAFFSKPQNLQKFKLLCRDGTTQKYLSNTNCYWTEQLPDLVVSSSNVALAVKEYLNMTVPKPESGAVSAQAFEDTFTQSLLKVLRLESGVNLTFLNSLRSLNTFVTDIRPIPVAKPSCKNAAISWCTTSEQELEKCQWLAQAAINRGIWPQLECVKTSNESSLLCLDMVKQGKANVVTTSVDNAYIAKKKELSTIAYPETVFQNRTRIVLAVKSSSPDLSSFKSLSKKKACIPTFAGKEFMSFAKAEYDNGPLKTKIRRFNDIDVSVSDFVDSSCMPGGRDDLREMSSGVDKDKICGLCLGTSINQTAAYCTDDSGNKYYPNSGSLRCLSEAGDFAVLSINEIDQNSIEQSKFNVICQNGTVAKNILFVDDACALAILPQSIIVSVETDPKKADVIAFLHEIENWFGQWSQKPFSVFDTFKGTPNLLFMDSTPGIDFKNQPSIYTTNLQKLLSFVSNPNEPGSGSTLTVSLIFSSLSILILLM